ncbi:MAG: AAA family ATPase, partial [Alphaproteobacteria bacterium]|nr:AAA family ATPase [Alphaproteobacteria bacterium]
MPPGVKTMPNHQQDIFGEQVQVQEPRIRLVAFDDIKVGTEPPYLIKGLIPRVGLTVVWGPPKSGKSFWTFDAVMHIALGWEYRGRSVQPGPVVYVAAEGSTGLRARVEAFRQHRIGDAHEGKRPFYLVPVNLDLIDESAALITAIKARLGDDPPAAVAIDTLNRTL